MALKSIFADGRYADQVVQFELKGHKRWGARDRRFFAESVYNLVRWWRLYLDALSLTQEQVLTKHEAMQKLLAFYLENLPEALSKKMRAEGRPFGTWASYPEELLEDFYAELGEDKAQKYLELMNKSAQVYLRVNSLKASAKQVQAALKELDISAEELGPTTLVLESRKNVFMNEAFRKGWFEVQDASSQQVAPMLAPKAGEFVIDACAGAGGKTLHIAALMENKGRLLAMDVHEKKLSQLKERARRAGVSLLNIRLIDSTKAIKRQHGTADALLLDVPCSGSGVLKRNPDTKWKWSEVVARKLEAVQRDLLQRYSLMVKPGGRMVYATCSVLPRENEDQVKWFLEQNSDWSFQLEKNMVPEQGDGFYAALLQRKPTSVKPSLK